MLLLLLLLCGGATAFRSPPTHAGGWGSVDVQPSSLASAGLAQQQLPRQRLGRHDSHRATDVMLRQPVTSGWDAQAVAAEREAECKDWRVLRH